MSRASQVFFKMFRNGASADMVVDGSSTAVNFDVTPVAGDKDPCIIKRVCIVGIDAGISPTEFFGINALSVGCRVVVVDRLGNEILDFLDGETIKQNSDWVLLAGTDNPTYNAQGQDQLAVRWTLTRGVGEPGLTLAQGQKLRVIIQDALAGVAVFKMMAQGTR